MNIKINFISLFISIIALQLSAQERRLEGVIRGTVTDAASGQTLPGATVVILDSNPLTGTVADERGTFLLNNLPIGRYAVQALLVGYESAVFREISVSSAKETFLSISLKERVNELGEVVVRSTVNKEEPLNRMATASARMLSVEVPNPTHFTDITGVGGGILSALSSQMLGNSDFFTGAFPAEYGNALSGVFDMQMRSGNNQRYEHAVQAGITESTLRSNAICTTAIRSSAATTTTSAKTNR
ncbi:MAG: carboxypeptidase-like regulatory domain-containing protein [Tannerellaceae bacterium]|jgi:hypothetical protein|nr:carboxypeptidase-like regulatory domain-containing protein [Tannerellaceae bacterium]